jgi:hypothetical protein
MALVTAKEANEAQYPTTPRASMDEALMPGLVSKSRSPRQWTVRGEMVELPGPCVARTWVRSSLAGLTPMSWLHKDPEVLPFLREQSTALEIDIYPGTIFNLKIVPG